MRTILFSLVALWLFTGCGGGSSNRQPQGAVNLAPTVASVADITIDGNGNGSVAITIDDDQTAAGDLTVSASSLASSLLPDGALAVSGTGGMRTVDVVPARDEIGDARVTVIVTDAQGLATSQSFNVTVVPRDTALAQFTRDLFAVDADGQPTRINALLLNDDAQNDGFDDLLATP